MIVDLGGKIQADSRELVAIVRLTDRGDRLVREARRQNRIVAGAQEDAKSAVLLAGARRPGGITENARLCLYGHTHYQALEEFNGITLINPGAVANKRYAIAEIDGSAFTVFLKSL